MTSDEKAKRIDAWNVILEFLKNVNASKLQEFNFDLKRELEHKGDYYDSRHEIGKEFVELKFTINHNID